jgi:hypothetical protein
MTTPRPYGLGRLQQHDERSRNFTFAARATVPKTVDWPIHAPVLDQGQLGSCTGNALIQWRNTDFAQAALSAKGAHPGYLDEAAAVSIYSAATRLDTIWGRYPPTDTGSSGLAVCKAGVRAGLISGYQHSFGFAALLLTLQHTPVIVGTEWLNDMFTPDSTTDVLSVSGPVEGGHEYLVRGANIERQLITMHNSWGAGWGVNGDAYIAFHDFQKLLAAGGDVTVPIV